MFHFDWTINVGTLCSAITLCGVMVNYGRKVVRYLSGISFRVNVMWEQFEVEHPDVVRQALRKHGAAL
jgi:hypothetical protein